MTFNQMMPHRYTKEELFGLQFPLFISPTIHGSRCQIVRDGVFLSKRPLINKSIRRELLKLNQLGIFDGVIQADDYNDLMREDKACSFRYTITDLVSTKIPYYQRALKLIKKAELISTLSPSTTIRTGIEVWSQEELWQRIIAFKQSGHDRVMIRSRRGLYEHHRCKGPDVLCRVPSLGLYSITE